MNWFKDRQISSKLIIGFLIVALIAISIGGVGVLNIINMEKASTLLYEQNAMSLKFSGAGASKFQQVRYHTINLATLKESDIAEAETYLKAQAADFETILGQLDQVISSPDAKTYLSDIHSYWDDYKTIMDNIVFHVEHGNGDLALVIIRETLAPIGASLVDSFQSLMDTVSEDADVRAGSNSQLAWSSIIIMAAVAFGGLVISVLLGLYISRIISKPLKKMAEASDRLAAGDIEIEMPAGAKDEVGQLTSSLTKVVEVRKRQVEETRCLAVGDLTVDIQINSAKDALGLGLCGLVESLNELIVSIMCAAEKVAAGSNLVSSSSMSLSMGATEQASSIQELTASVAVIAAQTTRNAKNAQSANAHVKCAKFDAEDGNAQMKNVLEAMETVTASSRNINKIIKVIDDIAFQTKILALNAAVEAARAGQHGKGFTVVAQEVRMLATKSADAANETSALIEDIIKKIEAGTKIAKGANNALNKIVEEVAKAADLVGAISIASNEQSSALDQISQGIGQVSEVVQNTAATSEECAAASEALAYQAKDLKETVGIFRIKEGYRKERVEAVTSLYSISAFSGSSNGIT